jgi:hypothetical protein
VNGMCRTGVLPPGPQADPREMSLANRRWGVPRIHGELLELGIEVAESTVAKCVIKRHRRPGQSWKTFYATMPAGSRRSTCLLLIAPTVGFKLLYCIFVLGHGRRIARHHAVTAYPTADWIARQIVEAFPWDGAPEYLVRDRDASYGRVVKRRLRRMGNRD